MPFCNNFRRVLLLSIVVSFSKTTIIDYVGILLLLIRWKDSKRRERRRKSRNLKPLYVAPCRNLTIIRWTLSWWFRFPSCRARKPEKVKNCPIAQRPRRRRDAVAASRKWLKWKRRKKTKKWRWSSQRDGAKALCHQSFLQWLKRKKHCKNPLKSESTNKQPRFYINSFDARGARPLVRLFLANIFIPHLRILSNERVC